MGAAILPTYGPSPLLTAHRSLLPARCPLPTAPSTRLATVPRKEKDCPRFYRRLLRAGRSGGHGLAYANKLRREVVATLPAATPLKTLIRTTGHSATACGAGLVAVIGGWRADDPTPHLHCLVIDVMGRALRVPTLTQASATPARRMRHASCAVRTNPNPNPNPK